MSSLNMSPTPAGMAHTTHANRQRVCAWGAMVMVALMTAGLLTAGFLPLPSPSMSAAGVTHLLTAHAFRIRLGMVLLAAGAAFLGPFVCELTVQLRRVEGRNSPLTWLNLAFGTLFVFEFILPCFVCLAATYRPHRAPQVSQALFDLCWLMFVGVVSTAVLQCFAIGVVILGDRRTEPVFPRWIGYVNLWTGTIFGAGSAIVFFKSGPLAWNGVIAFWLPLSIYGGWLIVMIWALLRAITQQERDDATAGTDHALITDSDIRHELSRLANEVASLRRERDPV